MSCSASQVSWVGNSLAVLCRLHNLAGTNCTQASITSITRNIYLAATGALLVGPTTLSKTTVISDTLLTTYQWTVDATGWNFKDEISGTIMTTAGALKIVYTVVASDGLQTVESFDYTTEPPAGG